MKKTAQEMWPMCASRVNNLRRIWVTSLKTISTLVLPHFFNLSANAQSLKVELISSPTLNAPVKLSIYANGVVGIENGLRRQTESVNVKGSAILDLGTTTNPGFYEFRFRAAHESEWLVVPILSDGVPTKPKPVALPTAEEDALILFLSLHTKERVKANWHTWPMGDQFGRNIVKVTAAGTLIIACPFEGVSCGPAVVETLNLAFDLTLDFEQFQAEQFQKAKLLSNAQFDEVIKALKKTKQAKPVLGIHGKLDAAFAALDLVLLEVDDKNLQIIFGLQLDEAKKARTLITTFKRK